MKFIVCIVVLPAFWFIIGNNLFGFNYFTEGELLNSILWNLPLCVLCGVINTLNWDK